MDNLYDKYINRLRTFNYVHIQFLSRISLVSIWNDDVVIAKTTFLV